MRKLEEFRIASDPWPNIGPTLQRAVYAEPSVCIPAGYYTIDQAVRLAYPGTVVVGEGPGYTANATQQSGGTRLVSSSPTEDIFHVADGSGQISIGNMSLSRSVVPAVGSTDWGTTAASAVNSLGSTGLCHLYNLDIENQFFGLLLRNTDYSIVENVNIHAIYGDGILFRNMDVAGGGGCQWNMQNVIVQATDGHAICVQAYGTHCAAITLGTWTNVNTFAAAGSGIYLAGSAATPIFGFRPRGLFLGGSQGSDIFMDTWGGQHNLVGVNTELCGQGMVGRTLSIPATGSSSSIVLQNNTNVDISGLNIAAPSRNGIISYMGAGSILTLTGGSIYSCGISGAGNGEEDGVQNLSTGEVFASGVYAQGGAHGYGVRATDGNKVRWTGGKLAGGSGRYILAGNGPAWPGNAVNVG